MDDVYNCQSGESIYAGVVFKPSWLTAASGEWGIIPTTNTLAQINPESDPALNPSYPAKAPWVFGSFAAKVTAWNGAHYDPIQRKLYVGPSGGHGDYGGNDQQALPLMAATPAFINVIRPTGSLPELTPVDDGQENSGLYADGRIRPAHTYNSTVYIPNVGPALGVLGSSVFKTTGGPNKPAIFDKDTGELIHFGAAPTFSIGSSVVTASAYDSNRHAIYSRCTGTGAIGRYSLAPDSVSGSWEQIGSTFEGLACQYLSLTYLPDYDCLVIVTNVSSLGVIVWDCATKAKHTPTVSGTIPEWWGQSSPKYIQGTKKLVTWNNNAGDTANLHTLTFDTDPKTGVWTVGVVNPALTNSVTPTAAQANGTYGRFFHDPSLKIFGVLNSVTEQPYYFNYEGWL